MKNTFVLWVYMLSSLSLSLSCFIVYFVAANYRGYKDRVLNEKTMLQAILIADFTFLWYSNMCSLYNISVCLMYFFSFSIGMQSVSASQYLIRFLKILIQISF